MAIFTEQAVLQVKEAGATANIRKINAELKKLFATKSLKSIRVDIPVNDSESGQGHGQPRTSQERTSGPQGGRGQVYACPH